MPTPHPSTLLCEECGYSIEGLPTTGACPECGREIASSLPERRLGSPWQRGPSLRSWWRTSLGLLRAPRAFWDQVRVDDPARGLLVDQCWIAAAGLALIPLIVFAPTRHGDTLLPLLVAAMVILVLGASVLMGLTLIEAAGARFFASRRGWRVPRAAAWSICAHAGVGWVLAGWLGLALALLGHPAALLAGATRPVLWSASGALVGLAVGFLVFEMLVYLGVHRLRYANIAPRPPADVPSPAITPTLPSPETP